MPVTFEQAFRAKAIRSGGWVNVPAFECPDLEGRVFWPDMPWHRPVSEFRVDEMRTAMLQDLSFAVKARCGFAEEGNTRHGVPYQLVDDVELLTRVWPINWLKGLATKAPLPPVVARFGDPTGFLGDSQWCGVDLSGPDPVLWEVGALGESLRPWVRGKVWQGRKVTRSDTGRPFGESDAVTASRIPLLALLPRPEELLAGRVPRALGISLPSAPRFHFPARGTDGMHPSLPIEYGDRLALTPETAQRARAKAPNIETVAVVNALEEFGAVAADRTMLEIDADANLRIVMDPRIDVQLPDLSIADFVQLAA